MCIYRYRDLPGDLRATISTPFEGVRSEGPTSFPEVANSVKGQGKANNRCQAS